MVNESSILLFVESRYKVNRKRIRSTVLRVLKVQNVTTPVEVSIAVVGDRKMRELNKKYRGLDKSTNVLSFSQNEGESLAHTALEQRNKNFLQLGDIVLSYPQVINDASRDNVLVDEKVDELVEHSLLHLLGIHHE